MKKILAVVTAIALAISCLCVFTFADDVTTLAIEGTSFTVGSSSTYDSGVLSITGNYKGDTGWFFGDDSTLKLSKFCLFLNESLASGIQLVITYTDGTNTTTYPYWSGTNVVVDCDSTLAIKSIVLNGQEATESEPTEVNIFGVACVLADATTLTLEGTDLTVGTSSTYDSGVLSITGNYKGDTGWFFGEDSTVKLNKFCLFLNESLTTGIQLVITYTDGTNTTTYPYWSGTNIVVDCDSTLAIKSIVLNGQEATESEPTEVNILGVSCVPVVETTSSDDGDGEDDGTFYSFEEDVTDVTTSGDVEYVVDTSGIAYIDINEADAAVTFALPSDVDVTTLQSITIEDADSTIDDLVLVVYADGVEVASATGSLTVDVSSVDLSSASSVTVAVKSTSSTASYCFYGITVTNLASALPTDSNLLTRFIYVNEEYHALVINREMAGVRRVFFISIPHDDDNHDGYCDTCKEYVGGEEEDTVESVIIDDVEYEVVYSNDDGIDSGDWTQVDLEDLELIDALSQEGAILVITRDTETTVSFADGEYEKFLLIDSWWSNNQQPIALGTAGHTSADEDVIDCTSDDGTMVVYDGATIYAAWEDGGYASGGSSLVFISNTSASYKIASIQVLVPVE